MTLVNTVQATGPSAAGLGVASNTRASGTAATLAELVDAYMAAYAGRDRTRVAQLARWVALPGNRAFASLTDEDLFQAPETIAKEPARVYVGRDADGRPIERAKGTRSPATVNRYQATISAVFTWAIKRRLFPRGWDNPARRLERSRLGGTAWEHPRYVWAAVAGD